IELFEARLREGRADRSSAELARLLGEMLFHGGRNGASERVLAQSIRILESVPDARAVELPAHLEMRARVLAELERFDEGEALLRRSLSTRRRNGRDELGLARGQSQLSSLLFLQGRYAEAADAGRAALESLGRHGAGAALHRAEMHTGLAVALIELDPFDPEAETHAREALRIALGELGPGHMVTLQARYNLATVLARSDRLPEALAITEENLRAAEASLGPSHSRVAYILTGLAKAYQTMGQPRRCASHARRAVTLRSEALGAASWRTAVSKTRLASCLAELGRAREAKELLEASIRVFESSEVEDDKHLLEARAQLAGLRAAERSS
ncbi:MAG: tetratricopeptide repeat protein, partial [Holophagales bacterium]|nr:tetratricopeptide repeat protein [Holophagales bacterium]